MAVCQILDIRRYRDRCCYNGSSRTYRGLARIRVFCIFEVQDMKTLALYCSAPIWLTLLLIAMLVFGLAATIWFFCFLAIGIFGALANGYYD